MFTAHEYSVIGHSRASVGRYLGVAAGLFSSVLATLIASVTTLAVTHGFASVKDFLALPITSAVFYAAGYFVFDRWAWQWPLVQKMIGIPCIGGKWDCKGRTINPVTGEEQYSWEAKVTIVQRWEKISVHVETSQSRSRSVAASLLKQDGVGAILMYSYRNESKPGEPELKSHFGYAEWNFTEALDSADAMYFNGNGRMTGGRMQLTRATQKS